MDAPPKRKYKHLNTHNNVNISNKISGVKSEIGDHKKHLGKKGNKHDTKSEIPNQNKLRLNKRSEISDKDENEIKLRDDLISEITENQNEHKRKDITSSKKLRKTTDRDLLKHSNTKENLVSNIRPTSKKKSTKKHVKIKADDNNIKDGNSFDVEEYIKTDPDDMDYDDAIKRDHRSFFGYFCDNLAADILLLNIFCKSLAN